jgi:hypothetical protein
MAGLFRIRSKTIMEPIAAPAKLLETILEKIHAARLRQLRARLTFAVFGVLSSVAFALSSRSSIWLELQQSSFIGFLRLAISDSDIAMANAKELGLGLLESIPLETVIVTLVCTFASLLAAAFFFSMRHERHASLIHHSV